MIMILSETYVTKLLDSELYYSDIPEEIKENFDFIKEMRKVGYITIENKGYDIIRDTFFVLEKYIKTEKDTIDEELHEKTFETFDEFCKYIDGDSLYEKSCYYQCSKERILKNSQLSDQNIDIDKMLTDCYYKPFTSETFSDSEIISQYFNNILVAKEKATTNMKEILKWLNKFADAMYSTKDFAKVYKKFEKTIYVTYEYRNFIFQNLIKLDKTGDYLKTFYDCVHQGIFHGYSSGENSLCIRYSIDEILKYYKYNGKTSELTQKKQKRNMKKYLLSIQDKTPKILKKYYNKYLGLYCIEYGYEEYAQSMILYFDKFEDFVGFLNNDLSDTDLQNVSDFKIDIKEYKINENTKLPATKETLQCIITKGYSRGKFYVTWKLVNENGNLYKEHREEFKYFFNYIYYLNGNLSNANLIFCDGLENLKDIDGLNLTNAKLKSKIAIKFGLPMKCHLYDMSKLHSEKEVEKNEENSLVIFNQTRDMLLNDKHSELMYQQSLSQTSKKIYYVSDLHLLHQIENHKCINKEDEYYLLYNIACFIGDFDGYVIIEGDVASDYQLYERFIQLLSVHVQYKDVFFVLGNHELWSFADEKIEKTVQHYKKLLKEHGMHLIHNNLFFENRNRQFEEITQEEIEQLTTEELSERLKFSRTILFGGIGFSGYNNEFNANNGIYRGALTREEEITETEKFYNLYNKVLPTLQEGKSVVVTHMPKESWSGNSDYKKGVVYVSGHTHRNFFYDDGETRVYADNQIGYHNRRIYKKFFYIDGGYDWFEKYDDGIYEITNEDYTEFYCGKNIMMSFSYPNLYMLKKDGFYCFIYKNKQGGLSILNGGALTKLEHTNIDYYYNNMSKMIEIINKPLKPFTQLQQNIAKYIKRIGGSGNIHGCIVDIDFFNHIFVNPNDGSICGYHAVNICDKTIYPSIPMLLEEKCPKLYINHLKLIEANEKSLLPTVITKKEKPIKYLDTSIYYASNTIKKMQRCEAKILTYWDDYALNKDRLLN